MLTSFDIISITLMALLLLSILHMRRRKTCKRCPEVVLKTRADASWASCDDGFYILPFRKRLDDIAGVLSRDNRTLVYTRFNRKRAEFLTAKGGVLVFVEVHGEVGYPYEVVITAPRVSGQARMLFDTLMPGNVKFIEAPC